MPQDRVAYNIWTHLGARFQRPIEKIREKLYADLMYLTGKNCTDDREYLHKFQDLRMRLARLSISCPRLDADHTLRNGISIRYKDFIQLKIEQQRVSNTQAVDLDIDTAIMG